MSKWANKPDKEMHKWLGQNSLDHRQCRVLWIFRQLGVQKVKILRYAMGLDVLHPDIQNPHSISYLAGGHVE